jgi:hypothetical protein
MGRLAVGMLAGAGAAIAALATVAHGYLIVAVAVGTGVATGLAAFLAVAGVHLKKKEAGSTTSVLRNSLAADPWEPRPPGRSVAWAPLTAR